MHSEESLLREVEGIPSVNTGATVSSCSFVIPTNFLGRALRRGKGGTMSLPERDTLYVDGSSPFRILCRKGNQCSEKQLALLSNRTSRKGLPRQLPKCASYVYSVHFSLFFSSNIVSRTIL